MPSAGSIAEKPPCAAAILKWPSKTSAPHRQFYREYKVERSPLAVLSPLTILNLVRGYSLKWAGKMDSTPLGLPAEFLIDASGTIVASHYGEHSSDQWAVDEVLGLAREQQRSASPAGPIAEGNPIPSVSSAN